MCAGELSLVRSALPPALLVACWWFQGLGWGSALLGWGWLLVAARICPSVGCGLLHSLARIHMRPSNLMGVALSRMWRLGVAFFLFACVCIYCSALGTQLSAVPILDACSNLILALTSLIPSVWYLLFDSPGTLSVAPVLFNFGFRCRAYSALSPRSSAVKR